MLPLAPANSAELTDEELEKVAGGQGLSAGCAMSMS
jgi:hypothetical protein